MLLPADAVPRETRRRTSRRRDRRRKKERERERESSIRGRGERESWSGAAAGRLAARGTREVRYGRSEEVEWGKSSARSTIFPSRRAVTFYLASFGECSDWSVGKEISFFLRGEGNAGERACSHTLYFSQPLSKRRIFDQFTLQHNYLKFRENLCHSKLPLNSFQSGSTKTESTFSEILSMALLSAWK